MLIVLALLVAVSCALASERRVRFAKAAMAVDPARVTTLAELRAAAEATPTAEWERELVRALDHGDAETRAALVNEQLTELTYRLDRWARVPRVCARVATSSGFLLGTLVMRRGLSDIGEVPSTLEDRVFHGFIGEAVLVVGCGIVGGLLSVSAHQRARAIVRARRTAADQLVERLEEERAAKPRS